MSDFALSAGDTLMTKNEVIYYSASKRSSHAEECCVHIATKEETLFRECFGFQFYIDLLNDRKKYSIDPANTEATNVNFREGTAYPVNTVVLYDGSLYNVNILTDGTQIPPLDEYFSLSRKFGNDAYEFVWTRYLAKIIGMSVMYSSVMYRLVQDTSEGLVKTYTDGRSQAASLKEAYAFKAEARGDIKDIIDNMVSFMKLYPTHFTNYKGLQPCDTGCDTKQDDYYGFNISSKSRRRKR